MDLVHLNKLFSISNWLFLIPCYCQNSIGDLWNTLCSNNICLIWFWPVYSLNMSHVATFSALDIRPPPTSYLRMVCLFTVRTWLKNIIIFPIVVVSSWIFYFHIQSTFYGRFSSHPSPVFLFLQCIHQFYQGNARKIFCFFYWRNFLFICLRHKNIKVLHNSFIRKIITK